MVRKKEDGNSEATGFSDNFGASEKIKKFMANGGYGFCPHCYTNIAGSPPCDFPPERTVYCPFCGYEVEPDYIPYPPNEENEKLQDIRVVNATPHEVVIYVDGEPIYDPNMYESTTPQELIGVAPSLMRRVMRFPPSGILPRCRVETIPAGEILSSEGIIPLTKTKMGEVENLPEEKEGTIYIVSRIVAEALPQRKDLYFPNESVRNEKGQIVGCRSLCTLQK